MIFRDQPDPTLTPRERARRARMAADPAAREPEPYPAEMVRAWLAFLETLPTTETEPDA